MVKSIGIDAGDYAVKTVEIDGSYRKTRLLRCHLERHDGGAFDGEVRTQAIAAAVATSLREGGMSGDMILGHPCREAVLRTIDVPFKGRDAIRKIVKSEVEGSIHSHAVDDMVVDFHELGDGPDGKGARILVAAVAKPPLRSMMTALAAEGLDPEHVDLDTMALFRVADWCGAFAAEGQSTAVVPADDAEGGDDGDDSALPAVAADGGISVVLDLGARSTRILIVQGGKLVDMRTLRLGDASIVDAVARASELPVAMAREAVHACVATGTDYRTEVAADLPAPVAGETDKPAAVAETRRVTVTAASVAGEQQAFLQRLERELVRFLTSSGRGAVQRLWVTGGACRMGGMTDMLAGVFSVRPAELDVIGRLRHSLTDEEAEQLGPEIAIAIGLALAPFGGPLGFEFRQEDLAYTRGFDRVKFPLAITCMIALFAAVVYGVMLNAEIKNLDFQLGITYEGKDAKPNDPKFYGELNAVLSSSTITKERTWRLQGVEKPYGFEDLKKDLAKLPVADRVKTVYAKVKDLLEKKQQESGIYEEVSLDSGLIVLVRFFDILSRAEPAMGKYLLCDLEIQMQATGAKEKSGRWLSARIAFHGTDFRERAAALRAAFDEDIRSADSPFYEIVDAQSSVSVFRDRDGAASPGAYSVLRLIVKESLPAMRIGQ